MTRWPPRPTLSDAFYKAHGLGNDYLVFEEGHAWPATEENVRVVCHRHRGIGTDGIVVLLAGPAELGPGQVRLRMFNPDGGEFERSGNGLRVLGSFLARRHSGLETVRARVGGAEVVITVHDRAGPVHDISVDMGRARTGAAAVGLDESILDGGGSLAGPNGEALTVVPVSVGNPHLVVLADHASEVTEQRLASLGPWLASHPSLENGANVQLAALDGDARCTALIWERGVGRTSASGTSACAVAVALVSGGRLAPGEISVRMPGGVLQVTVSADPDVVLRGPVEEISEGRLTPAVVASLSA